MSVPLDAKSNVPFKKKRKLLKAERLIGRLRESGMLDEKRSLEKASSLQSKCGGV